MADWPSLAASLNAIEQQTFGEPVVYQPVQAGQPMGDPFTVTAIRHKRPSDEAGAAAPYEEISVNPADFSTAPMKGDWVTAWGTQFVVGPVRQPDPYGMFILTLKQRAGHS